MEQHHTSIELNISHQNEDQPTFADKQYTQDIAKTLRLTPTNDIKILEISAYQQTQNNTCGPSVVMALLNYYGLLDESNMNKETEVIIAKEMGTTSCYGTTAEQIVEWLNCNNLKATINTNGRIEDLIKNLNNGIPTLVNWIDWGGHWVLVSGIQKSKDTTLQDNKDVLFLSDPAVNFNSIKTIYGLTAINIDRFKNMWFDSRNIPGIYITVEKPN